MSAQNVALQLMTFQNNQQQKQDKNQKNKARRLWNREIKFDHKFEWKKEAQDK